MYHQVPFIDINTWYLLFSWTGNFSSIGSVQSLSRVRFFATPWTAARQASLSITNSRSSSKLTCIESVMPSCPSHPLLSPSPPALNLSQHQGLFQWVSSSHRWPNYWSISPSNEYSRLISFRIDRLDLLAVQRTLKSLLTPQFKSINSSVLSFLYSPTLTSIHD